MTEVDSDPQSIWIMEEANSDATTAVTNSLSSAAQHKKPSHSVTDSPAVTVLPSSAAHHKKPSHSVTDSPTLTDLLSSAARHKKPSHRGSDSKKARAVVGPPFGHSAKPSHQVTDPTSARAVVRPPSDQSAKPSHRVTDSTTARAVVGPLSEHSAKPSHRVTDLTTARGVVRPPSDHSAKPSHRVTDSTTARAVVGPPSEHSAKRSQRVTASTIARADVAPASDHLAKPSHRVMSAAGGESKSGRLGAPRWSGELSNDRAPRPWGGGRTTDSSESVRGEGDALPENVLGNMTTSKALTQAIQGSTSATELARVLARYRPLLSPNDFVNYIRRIEELVLARCELLLSPKDSVKYTQCVEELVHHAEPLLPPDDFVKYSLRVEGLVCHAAVVLARYELLLSPKDFVKYIGRVEELVRLARTSAVFSTGQMRTSLEAEVERLRRLSLSNVVQQGLTKALTDGGLLKFMPVLAALSSLHVSSMLVLAGKLVTLPLPALSPLTTALIGSFASLEVTLPLPALSPLTNALICSCAKVEVTLPLPALSPLTNALICSCAKVEVTLPLPALSPLTNALICSCAKVEVTLPLPALSPLTNALICSCAKVEVTLPLPALSPLTTALIGFCASLEVTSKLTPKLTSVEESIHKGSLSAAEFVKVVSYLHNLDPADSKMHARGYPLLTAFWQKSVSLLSQSNVLGQVQSHEDWIEALQCLLSRRLTLSSPIEAKDLHHDSTLHYLDLDSTRPPQNAHSCSTGSTVSPSQSPPLVVLQRATTKEARRRATLALHEMSGLSLSLKKAYKNNEYDGETDARDLAALAELWLTVGPLMLSILPPGVDSASCSAADAVPRYDTSTWPTAAE
eukprot:gene7359-482_t